MRRREIGGGYFARAADRHLQTEWRREAREGGEEDKSAPPTMNL